MTSSPLAAAALALATAHEIPSMLNHSLRTHGYALLHAEKRGLAAGADYDSDLLFVACVLHDLGSTGAYDGPQRFEVEGADAAASLLEDHGRAPADIDQVWQAIALHSVPGIAERRGPVPLLTRLGMRTDFFSVTIPDELRAAAEREYPRLGLDHELGALLVEQALRQPEKARGPSWVSDLVREQQHSGLRPAPDTL
jgi:hypothetical protein